MQTDSLEQREQLAQLDNAIAKLPHGDRQLILMRYLQTQEIPAIAAALGIEERAARKRISRAIERLRARLVGRADAPSVEALLAAAGVHVAPASVHLAVAAVSGGAVAPAAAALAHGLGRALVMQKLALPIAIVLSTGALVATGAVLLVPLIAAAPPPLPPNM